MDSDLKRYFAHKCAPYLILDTYIFTRIVFYRVKL